MKFQVCDICKVQPKIPEDVCISCAYDSEYSRRILLERHLFQLLDLQRAMTSQIEAAVAMVQRGNIDPLELAKALEVRKILLPAPKAEVADG